MKKRRKKRSLQRPRERGWLRELVTVSSELATIAGFILALYLLFRG
jgi:hypothetical protein